MWTGIPQDWGRGHYRDIPISKYVQLVRDRQVRDLERARAGDPDFPYFFDEKAADHAVWFFQQLRHFDGEFAGQPFTLSDWQEWDIVRVLFGWKRLSDGFRRFRKAYIEIARGNGKSMLASGIGGLLFCGDGEHGAQVFATATLEQQAKVVWEGFYKQASLNPEFRDEVRKVGKVILNEELGATFRVLGRDSKKQDGWSVHGGIVDEYHEHKTDAMLEVLASGTVKRRQPLIAIITTAGFNVDGPCKSESDYVKRLLEGELHNESYFGFIATVDNPDNWKDEVEHIKANPNWGISVYPEGFRAELAEAIQKPAKQYRFKTKNLNIWCGEAQKWIVPADFRKCQSPINWEEFKGMRCYLGLDLGISRDISAAALAFTKQKPEKGQLTDVYLKMKYWIPEEGMQQRYEEDGVPYPTWVEQGWIKKTPGRTTRRDIIRADINELGKEFEIALVAADKAHAIELLQNLQDDSFDIKEHGQNLSAMTYPSTVFEDLIAEVKLHVDEDPVFRWMVHNAVAVRARDDLLKPVKDLSSDRIDGVVAAVMAVGQLMIAPEPVGFVYHKRKGIYVG